MLGQDSSEYFMLGHVS